MYRRKGELFYEAARVSPACIFSNTRKAPFRHTASVKRILACLTGAANIAGPLLFGAALARIPFPDGFRQWTHVKSAIVTSGHPAAAAEGGIHHIYANPKAAEGYSSGQFPEGAAIVYELLETTEKDGVISEGPRRRLDLMVKDSAAFPTTAGWGFARFREVSGASELSDEARVACFECHRRAAGHGFVFSRMR